MPASSNQNNGGSGTKPSVLASGEKGRVPPIATITREVMSKDLLARLCRKGTLFVRIM